MEFVDDIFEISPLSGTVWPGTSMEVRQTTLYYELIFCTFLYITYYRNIWCFPLSSLSSIIWVSVCVFFSLLSIDSHFRCLDTFLISFMYLLFLCFLPLIIINLPPVPFLFSYPDPILSLSCPVLLRFCPSAVLFFSCSVLLLFCSVPVLSFSCSAQLLLCSVMSSSSHVIFFSCSVLHCPSSFLSHPFLFSPSGLGGIPSWHCC